MDQFDDPLEGLRWGVRFILMMSVVGQLCMSIAWLSASSCNHKQAYSEIIETHEVSMTLPWDPHEKLI
jgi:hypothetical protein